MKNGLANDLAGVLRSRAASPPTPRPSIPHCDRVSNRPTNPPPEPSPGPKATKAHWSDPGESDRDRTGGRAD